jgi:hypothetical protein
MMSPASETTVWERYRLQRIPTLPLVLRGTAVHATQIVRSRCALLTPVTLRVRFLPVVHVTAINLAELPAVVVAVL